jgi:AAA15 family ATPase/GTPase
MIKKLFLKNFRGIKTGHLKDFSQINILLGPNNSGKTTILEALYFISCMSHGEIIHKTNYFQGVIPKKDFLGYDPLILLQEKHGMLQWENNPGQYENGLIRVSTKNKFWQISPYKKNLSYEFKPKDVNKIGYCGIDYTKKDLNTKAQTHIKEWLNLTLTEKDIETLPEKGRVSLLWFQKFVYENENIQ